MQQYHKLWVVSTPIGNLAEISQLARDTLANANVIICEDSRVTKKLLVALNINFHQKLISYHKMNEQEKTQLVLEHLKVSECVLVSDAGYPIISDPGFHLIHTLRKANSPIQVVNGPCALIHALVSSGIACSKFMFANFLTKKVAARMQELQTLKTISHWMTIVYYEPVHYLLAGLKCLLDVFGDIEIGIGRELTKLHETHYFGKISQLMTEVTLKGEFVIIIPMQPQLINSWDWKQVQAQMQTLVHNGYTIKQAAKTLATKTHSASRIYQHFIRHKTN